MNEPWTEVLDGDAVFPVTLEQGQYLVDILAIYHCDEHEQFHLRIDDNSPFQTDDPFEELAGLIDKKGGA